MNIFRIGFLRRWAAKRFVRWILGEIERLPYHYIHLLKLLNKNNLPNAVAAWSNHYAQDEWLKQVFFDIVGQYLDKLDGDKNYLKEPWEDFRKGIEKIPEQ